MPTTDNQLPHLALPDKRYKASFLAAAVEYAAVGPAHPAAADFEGLVALLRDQREGRNLPAGFVPCTALWLVLGDQYLGSVSIRHALTPYLERVGGHIGYDIRPSVRRRGYGTLALQLALPWAKQLGIDPALITCDETNIASRRIIEANGGILAERYEQPDGPAKLRFWTPTG